MPRRPKHLLVTPKGNPVASNPARMELAFDEMRAGKSWGEIVDAIKARFEVDRATAARDILAAKRLLAAELGDRVMEQAQEALRMERVAEKAEAEGEYHAAVAASREKSRLLGLHAPKQLEVTHTDRLEIALEIDATLSVLDEADHEALRRIAEKIEAARAAGRLPSGEDVQDAEIVEPGPGEN
jgi:hypothetical protein